MRCSRIVDICLYAVRLQMFLKCVTVVCADDENMPDMGVFIINLRQNDFGINDIFTIKLCDFAAAGIVCVKIFEFDIKDCRLKFIKTGVYPFVNMMIFIIAAVIGNGFDFFL